MTRQEEYEFEQLFEEEETFSSLVGKRIESIFLSEDEEILLFNTNAGILVYETEAECCSSTFFADITGIEALIGHSVLKVVLKETREFEGTDSEDYELDDDSRTLVMGESLITLGGYADIMYRNESNGYYTGYVVKVTKGEKILEILNGNEFRQITKDWSYGEKE